MNGSVGGPAGWPELGEVQAEGRGPAGSEQTPARLFAERTELVYFLDPEHSQAFVDGVEAHLRPHVHGGGVIGTSPPAHYVTTLYFDSDTHEIARTCERGEENVKLRAREYYDREPDLTVRREPFLWLEVKTRTGSRTRKVRVAIPTDEVGSFLREGVISRRMLALQRSIWGKSAEVVTQAISELCKRTTEPLKPDCLAHYRRRAWQDVDELIRITLDSELAFYRPPANIFTEIRALSDALIGPPVGRLSRELIEIKLHGEPPAWLRRLILDTKLEPATDGRRAFSKFVAASHAVHTAPKASGPNREVEAT